MGERKRHVSGFFGSRSERLLGPAPTASISDPELFFSKARFREWISDDYEMLKHGSISVIGRRVAVSGCVEISGSKFEVWPGMRYHELHFVPNESLLKKGDIKQAGSLSEAVEYLYLGARDLLKVMEDKKSAFSYTRVVVGLTNDRLSNFLVRRLGFSSLGKIVPADPDSTALIIRGSTLYGRTHELADLRDRLAPIVEPVIDERKRTRNTLIHEVSQKLPM